MNSYRVKMVMVDGGVRTGHRVFVEGPSTPEQARIDAERSFRQHMEYQETPVRGSLTVTGVAVVPPYGGSK